LAAIASTDFFFHLTVVGYVLVLSSHTEMCFTEVKNSYSFLKSDLLKKPVVHCCILWCMYSRKFV